MTYVQTPTGSRFGGLILPQDTLAKMISQEVSASYSSVRRDNKNTANWDVSIGSADADTLPHIDMLRWQVRDLDRNNPLAAGALDTVVDNVVATGIRPQSVIDRDILGLSEDEAAAWQANAERYFYIWADSRNADVTRYATFWEYQALVLLNALLSGDVFTVRRYKMRPDSVFGLCLQLVEADRCETPTEKQVDADIHKGVQADNDGEPVAYHFLKKHPGDIGMRRLHEVGQFTTVAAVDKRGFDLCLHHFQRRRPDQRRGVSVLAPAIECFKQLSRYTEAEITAAVVSSLFSVLVKSETGGLLPSVLPGQIPGQVGGQSLTPAGSPVTQLQSGMIMDLRPGESVDVVNPNRPNVAFESFLDAVYKYIGVGIGLPKEVLLKQFNTSYSAARAAIMEAFKMYRRRRQWLVKTLCQPVWGLVIAEAVGRGYLDAPGFFDDPLRRAAWLGAEWRGAPMGHLDPLKEARAAREWLGMPGVTTMQQITAEQFGTDWDDNIAQTDRERKRVGLLPPDPLMPDLSGGNKEDAQEEEN